MSTVQHDVSPDGKFDAVSDVCSAISDITHKPSIAPFVSLSQSKACIRSANANHTEPPDLQEKLIVKISDDLGSLSDHEDNTLDSVGASVDSPQLFLKLPKDLTGITKYHEDFCEM